jgi:hypothetical protein
VFLIFFSACSKESPHFLFKNRQYDLCVAHF